MIVPFKYYLHDESFYEGFEQAFEDTPIAEWTEEEQDELRQKIGKPFYEVTLHCTVETDTGAVTILKVIP